MSTTDTSDWDFVLQFVSEPLDLDVGPSAEKPVAERAEPPPGTVPSQVPTPPVCDSAVDILTWIMLTYLAFRHPSSLHQWIRPLTRAPWLLFLPHSFRERSFNPSCPTLCYYRPTRCSSTPTRIYSSLRPTTTSTPFCRSPPRQALDQWAPFSCFQIPLLFSTLSCTLFMICHVLIIPHHSSHFRWP